MSTSVNNTSCFGRLNLINMSVISLDQSVHVLTVSLAYSADLVGLKKKKHFQSIPFKAIIHCTPTFYSLEKTRLLLYFFIEWFSCSILNV